MLKSLCRKKTQPAQSQAGCLGQLQGPVGKPRVHAVNCTQVQYNGAHTVSPYEDLVAAGLRITDLRAAPYKFLLGAL